MMGSQAGGSEDSGEVGVATAESSAAGNTASCSAGGTSWPPCPASASADTTSIASSVSWAACCCCCCAGAGWAAAGGVCLRARACLRSRPWSVVTTQARTAAWCSAPDSEATNTRRWESAEESVHWRIMPPTSSVSTVSLDITTSLTLADCRSRRCTVSV